MTSDHLPSELARGRLAGIDFGTVRIGIALSDAEQRWVSPWAIRIRTNRRLDGEYFRTLVTEQQIQGFVVGLPIHLNGTASQKSREAQQFGQWLASETGVPVTFFDERFTSREAEHLLHSGGPITRKKKQARLDAVAAQILLQAYLESHASQPSSPAADNIQDTPSSPPMSPTQNRSLDDLPLDDRPLDDRPLDDR